MSEVRELQPGDIVHLRGVPLQGVFITSAPHPAYPNLRLVVWRLSDGTWSFDALRNDQYIGQIKMQAERERGATLMAVLAGLV